MDPFNPGVTYHYLENDFRFMTSIKYDNLSLSPTCGGLNSLYGARFVLLVCDSEASTCCIADCCENESVIVANNSTPLFSPGPEDRIESNIP